MQTFHAGHAPFRMALLPLIISDLAAWRKGAHRRGDAHRLYGACGRGTMGMTLSELRAKEVIDVRTGQKLGRVMDIEFCVEDARVLALVLPAETGLWQQLRGERCGLALPWAQVERIGEDVILVRQDGGV